MKVARDNLNPRNPKLKISISIAVFVLICLLAIWGASQFNQVGIVWYSIVPPLLAITMAIVTNRLLTSLGVAVGIGIILSSVQKNVGFEMPWFLILGSEGWSISKSVIGTFNLSVIIFIVLILSMISVMIISGGMQGVINWLSQFAKGSRSTQLVTVLMGLAIFIDDYANTMIVGSAMRPVTDKKKISREKLAFLVDATTAPVAGLAIVSTWIGYEIFLFTSTAESIGIDKDGYSMFFDALGYRFYCLMMVIFVFVNVISGRDFGEMLKAEKRSHSSGAVLAVDATPMTSKVFSTLSHNPAARISSFSATIPIVMLFGTMVTAFWFYGGSLGSFWSWTTWREILSRVAEEGNNVQVLAIGSGVGLFTAIFFAIAVSGIGFGQTFKAILLGLNGSLLPSLILILAWGLKEVCDALRTGDFLGATVSNVISPVWFPTIIFVVAALTSFATGTSWGTMAILIPTATPIAFGLDGSTYGITTIICLGAVLDGSIFGDHCSPISDTTIMSSISSSCDHIHHVRTQLPYSLTVAGLAIIFGYLPAAFRFPPWFLITCATGVIVLIFLFVAKPVSGSR